MVKRRKFVIGLGALAAGGSAVMGTGAMSSTSAQRNIEADIVGDNKAFLKVDGSGNAENGWVVEYDSGEVELVLDDPDETSDVPDGQGLNGDAVTTFDDAFRVQNQGDEEVELYFTSPYDRLRFYRNSDPTSSMMGSANSVVLLPTEDASASEATVNVGIWVDMRGKGKGATPFSGSDDFTIHADDLDDDQSGANDTGTATQS